MLILNEELFDEIDNEEEIPVVDTKIVTDTEIEPDGPEVGEKTGIANLIHDLIIEENELIQNFNGAVANMEHYPELQDIMQSLAGDEFAHIGELQKALEIVSPNASNIEEGEVESEEALDPGSPVDEAYRLAPGEEPYNIERANEILRSIVTLLDEENYNTLEEASKDIIEFLIKDYNITNSEIEEVKKIIAKKFNSLTEDTKKKSNGKWVNKGSEGEHGEFKTKKEADAQRKAMFANGFSEELETESLNISDDYRALKIIDKVLRTCEGTRELPTKQREFIADSINDALHSISKDIRKR